MNIRNQQVAPMEGKGAVPDCPGSMEMDMRKAQNDNVIVAKGDNSYSFNDFLESTTMHGVKYTTRAYGKPRRLLWGVVIVILVICLTASFSQLVHRFIRGETTTVVTHEEATYLEFPAVTLCNINLVTKDELGESSVKDQSHSTVGNTRNKTANTNADSTDVLNEIRRLSHDIEDMLKGCRWLSEYPCLHINFTETLTNAGMCYTFNSGLNANRSVLQVSGSGSANGLWLRLNVEQEKYTATNDFAAGFRVLLHSPYENPDEMKERSFFISPGWMTRVSVNKHSLSRLQEYCSSDTSDNNYTTYRCRAECQSKYVEEQCGCRLYYADEGELPLCSNTESLKCSRDSSRHCHCSPPCNEDTYVTSNSFAYYPAETLAESLSQSQNMSKDQLKINLAELTIFYQSLRVEHSKMVMDYTLTSLFSDVGGSIGLCIGASILTLLEFVEMFWLKCYQCGKRS